MINLCTNSATVTYTSTIIESMKDSRGHSVGGIAGINVGTVQKCINTGGITGTEQVGGIVGFLKEGTTQLCVNKGKINSDKILPDYAICGGIVGFLAWEDTGKILNCYNTGTVISVDNAGGITGDCVGNNGTATIINCYNIGNVSGVRSKGSILGQKNYNGKLTISNNYWLSTTGPSFGIGHYPTSENTGASSDTGCTSKTAAQLKALTSTLGSAYKADSNNINGGYPILSWQ